MSKDLSHILRRLRVLSCTLVFAVFVLCGCGIGHGVWAATYYIDPAVGNDANLGTSPDRAWATEQKVNRQYVVVRRLYPTQE